MDKNCANKNSTARMDLCSAARFTALALNTYARKDCTPVVKASCFFLEIVEDLLKKGMQKTSHSQNVGFQVLETRFESVIDKLISLVPGMVDKTFNDGVLDSYSDSELTEKYIQTMRKSEVKDLLSELKISPGDPCWVLSPHTTLLNEILEKGDLKQCSVDIHYRNVLNKILKVKQGWQSWVYLNKKCGTCDMYVQWLRERAATDPSSNIQVFPEISYCPVCGGYIEGVLITSEMQLELWLMCPSCAFIWREQHEYRNKWRKLIDQAFPWF